MCLRCICVRQVRYRGLYSVLDQQSLMRSSFRTAAPGWPARDKERAMASTGREETCLSGPRGFVLTRYIHVACFFESRRVRVDAGSRSGSASGSPPSRAASRALPRRSKARKDHDQTANDVTPEAELDPPGPVA
jgi:hypothetical protein